MDADEKRVVDGIADAILQHLQAHPLAADSVDGVARWWLGPAFASARSEQVERALDLLVSRCVLRRVSLMDGSILYVQASPTRQ
jgi:hypothetical protein